MMRVRWIVLVLVVTMFGCNTLGGKKKQKEEEDIKTAQEALKRSQVDECLRLSTTPNSLLEPSAIKYHDQGIINDYRQLSEVTVLNRAQFCSVKSAQGDVTWMDAQGRRFGSTPFSLKKSVAAGATEKFSIADGTLTSGTLAGSASQAKVTFTAVEVIYPPP